MNSTHNIFAYVNYRTYLKDYYECKKKENPRFSYRLFSRMAGFSSPNFIKLVMMGQRNLSEKGIPKVAKALKLDPRAATFFETLVQFNQSSSQEEKRTCYEKLGYFKEFNRIKKIEKQEGEYLSHWFNVAIREMTLLHNFRADPVWIVRKLKKQISESMATGALSLLEQLELIKKNSLKRLKPTARNLATDPEIMEFSAAEYHHQMIELASRSIEDTPAQLRDISSVTVAIDEPTFDEAKKRIQQFRRELNVLLSNCKKPDSVYQINFQIFNLTEVPWKKASLKS